MSTTNPPPPQISPPHGRTTSTSLCSTPFEMDYYDGPSSRSSSSDAPPLACPAGTRLVVGLNKYTHDTSLCAADARTGRVLFAVSKERLTRKKHDGGNVAGMVELCLEALGLDYYADGDGENQIGDGRSIIEKVVMNNHHHRILPLEQNARHLEWEAGLRINGGDEAGYDDEYNLLTMAGERLELSHHLAHAYSTATQAPFKRGMVVVMDGMGESYRTMLHAKLNGDATYVSDLSFPCDGGDGVGNGFAFDCIPGNLAEQAGSTPFDWREAESVYVFEKKDTTIDLRPVFKRFTPERSPPSLYNHGFENMDSVGALYSRASSHIFGDWNACGKVMGLAPWTGHSWKKLGTSLAGGDAGEEIRPPLEGRKVIWGTLYSEKDGEEFQQDKDVISGMPLIARMDSDLFDAQGNLAPKRRYDFDGGDDDSGSNGMQVDDDNDDAVGQAQGREQEPRLPTRVALEAIALAHRIQIDLEDIVMDFVKHFRAATGEENLCIAGGVGLNSVLNGRLARELGFEQTFVSPYPGDDGIAVGCCAYGLFGNEILDRHKTGSAADGRLPNPPVWDGPLSPYLGPDPSEAEIRAAIDEASPWLEVEAVRDEGTRLDMAVAEIELGGVVAWYQGRSELGPRALGHRSILADPRKGGLVRFINQYVKKRESFRPFAPSVLAEHAAEWFDLDGSGGVKGGTAAGATATASPYMSLTAMVRADKRARIPAVTHVDGSSRLQTVTAEADPLYHRLITKFYDLTGVPMVLNTSFNTLPGEPIVETPVDAVRSFLCSMGSIEMLVLGDYVVKRRQADLRSLLGEADRRGESMVVQPSCPRRTGPATFETTFEADDEEMAAEEIVTKTRVRMPDRPMHSDTCGGQEWYELLDELEGELLSVCDGTNTLNRILAEYTEYKVPAGGDADDDPEAEGEALAAARIDRTQDMLQNIVRRLVRLYESTLISW